MEVEAIDRKIFIRGLEGAILVNWGVRLIHKSFYVDFFVRKNDLFLIRKEGVDVPKEVPGLITGENVEIIPFVMLEKSERKYFLEGLSPQKIDDIIDIITENSNIFFTSTDEEIKSIEITQDLAIIKIGELTISIPFQIRTIEPTFSFPIKIECDGKFSGKILLRFIKALNYSSELLVSNELYNGKIKTKGISIDIVRMNVSLNDFPVYAVVVNNRILYYGLLMHLIFNLKVDGSKKEINILGPVIVYHSPL